jgi:hypothetical protein
MRTLIPAVLVLSGLTLCACTSSQVPSWAMASADPVVHSSQRVAKHNATVNTQARNIERLDNAKTAAQANYANNESTKQNDGAGFPGSVPSKYKNLTNDLRELDLREEEENRRIKAAITICHC